jgi:MipA family protein
MSLRLFACLLTLSALPAHAQTFPSSTARTLPKWEFGLGGLMYSLPDYRGADHQSTGVLPIPYFYYRGDVLKADRGGVRGELYESDRLDLEISLNGGVPVSSDKNEARRGMADLDPTLEVGPQGILRIIGKPLDVSRLDLRLPVRQVIGMEFGGKHSALHNAGLVFTPALNYSHTPRNAWHFGAQAGLYFATKRYHQYLYGVGQEYATSSRPAYEAKGGYGGWQVTTSLSRRFNKIFVGGFVRASSVNGATFDDSPLVRRKYNYSAGIGISWVFSESAERVPARDED